MLSIRNLYLPAAAVIAAAMAVVLLCGRGGCLVLLPLGAPWVAAGAAGRRWRLVDLGAGEELRNHELSRRWLWQPAPSACPGERQYLRSQGELVHERPWPASVEYVSMSARGGEGARLPLGAGAARCAVRRDGRG